MISQDDNRGAAIDFSFVLRNGREAHHMKRGWFRALAALVAACALVGCGSDAPDNASVTPTSTPAAAVTKEPLPTYVPNGEFDITAVNYKNARVRGYAPLYSPEEAFHEESFELFLFWDDPDGIVMYTTDGSEPTPTNGTRYYGPIALEATSGDYPDAHIIRSKIFYADGTVSPTASRTYFVSEGISKRFRKTSDRLVIVSIAGEDGDFLGGPGGILYRENYTTRGDASERPAHIEMFDRQGTLIADQSAGVRVYGAYSRRNEVKSLKLFARKSYDSEGGRFRYDFFGSTDTLGRPVESYDKLVLRSYGNDWQFAFLRDELNQRLLQNAGYPFYEAVVPAIVYLNGSFYNFVWMHESYCDAYFKKKSPLIDASGKSGDKGEFVVIGGSEKHKDYDADKNDVAECNEFNHAYDELSRLDLTVDENYDKLCRFMDVENYLDYYAANIYVCNCDWPHNNYKVYRYYPAKGASVGTGIRDGRWRFLPHDMDYCYNIYDNRECEAATDLLAQVLAPGQRYSPLFTALMKRESSRNYFIRKIISLADGAFSYSAISAEIDDMTSEQGAEIPLYIANLKARYNTAGQWGNNIWCTEESVKSSLTAIRTFAKARKENILVHIQKAFGLTSAELSAIIKGK